MTNRTAGQAPLKYLLYHCHAIFDT